jgi:hypothetical protein
MVINRLALVGMLLCCTSICGAEPRVDLEVLTEGGFIGNDPRAWSEMLTKAGFSSVRIKSGGGEGPMVQTLGIAAAPNYRVVGVLTAQNQLLLPKGRFGPNDRAQIESWLRKLREGGEEGISVKPAAFGLLPTQLVAAHEGLATPVGESTLGQPPREAAKKIADRLAFKFISDTAAQQALAEGEPVADELQGIASGTALAAILRPLGLVMVPEKVMVPGKNGAEIRLRIVSGADAKEHWPVGWPPKGNPNETLPELFKFLKVNIGDAALSEAVAAIAERVKVPVLYDHNALAAARADMAAKVSLAEPNIFYGRALDRLLSQAKLKYEIRVDEAEKPFLWVTAR